MLKLITETENHISLLSLFIENAKFSTCAYSPKSLATISLLRMQTVRRARGETGTFL